MCGLNHDGSLAWSFRQGQGKIDDEYEQRTCSTPPKLQLRVPESAIIGLMLSSSQPVDERLLPDCQSADHDAARFQPSS